MDELMLRQVPLPPELTSVKEQLIERFGPDKVSELVSPYVWARHAVALGLLTGGSVLDVGAGHGLLLNAAALSGRFDRLVGVDVADFELFTRLGKFTRSEQSATDLRYRDDEFDTAVAMEILEHLDDHDYQLALAEVRRVSKRRIITVPYRESEPMLPYHLQRFDDDRLAREFPDAKLTWLRKPGGLKRLSWVLIEE